MNIIQDFIPAGRKNRPGRANPMKYVTIHNTGNSSKGAGAKNHAAYAKGDYAANLPVSWHYTVDETVIYQHLPDTEDAFHAGDGSGNGNRQSIGIEICMNPDGNLLKATDDAAELTAYLCKKHNIPVENVVQHNKWSGKNCPQRIREGKPYNWDTFINKVKSFMGTTTAAPQTPAKPTTPTAPIVSCKVGDIVQFGGGGVYTSSNSNTATATKPASRCKVTQVFDGKHPYHLISEDGKGVYGWVDKKDITANETIPSFKPYMVKITGNPLSIYKGPGKNTAVCGQIKDNGIYTIVGEADGPGAKKWGQLISGAGYISLDYTKRI